MSCNSCQSKFTFFTRESGCPNCGFSYCSKCLKYKLELPTVGVKKVCGKCYNKSQIKNKMSTDESVGNCSPSGSENKESLPLVINKLDLLENPSKPPIVIYKQEATHWDRLKVGMEPADQEIIDRLKKLKEEDKQPPLPSIDEINRRLALLKDKDPENMEISPTADVHSIDTRTDEQKRDDLLKRYMEQLNIKEITSDDPQRQLDSLTTMPRNPSKIPSELGFGEDEDDDESEENRIINKALEEAAIEAQYDDADTSEELEVSENDATKEELMCEDCGDTNDLAYCKSCKGKLYCFLCFEDNHDEDEVDMRKHIRVPVKKSKELVMN